MTDSVTAWLQVATQRAWLLLVLLLLLTGPRSDAAQAQQAGLAGLNQNQITRILHLGPWPQPWQPDISNRVSGKAEAIDLGRRMFFDARMSPTGQVSCSSCHRPERGWTDGRQVGRGLADGRRNTPSLFDVRLQRWFGLAGGTDSLWAQSVRPLLDPSEMGSNAAHVKSHLQSHADLSSAYATAFGRHLSSVDEQTVLVDAAKALAAFQETITSGRTPFDMFRDALSADDWTAANTYPARARRGLALFVGAGKCSACHAGPMFSDGSFRRVATARGDTGRLDDLAKLQASPYNREGAFNDDPAQAVFWRGELSGGRPNAVASAFRVPSLRNVARTAPYLHDGSRATLQVVLANHAPGRGRLSAKEADDLIGFLETLTVVAPQ